MKTNYWDRRKFFDAYDTGPNVWPPEGTRVPCPCCGYPTLRSWAEFEICCLCHWEDDGQDDRDADLVGGPNGPFSLVEARENFELYLLKYPPELDTRIGSPDSPREIEIKQTMIAAFEQMMANPAPGEIQALWRKVIECERELYQELKIRISGPLYEGAPCPYCGKRLRTHLAKQCRHCAMDWHNPDNVISLKSI